MLPASALTIAAIITSMKLASYVHCNATLRAAARKAAHGGAGSGGSSQWRSSFSASGGATPSLSGGKGWPANLSVPDVAYYMAAPTLTYQLDFPRTPRVRPRLVAYWAMCLVVSLALLTFMQVQFLLPLMQSSLASLHQLDLLRFTERLLRLAIPNVAAWCAHGVPPAALLKRRRMGSG